MIGKFIKGKSFGGCISYCLEGKIVKKTGEELHPDRAEIIAFNQCYGSKKELIEQFNEVRALNKKLSQPVMHLTLSLAPGEQLEQGQLAELAHNCASYFGFNGNQYIAVSHKDSEHQHIHIVANRIGFDRKTVSDSQSFRKMAEFCRRSEKRYGLKELLSPKAFLPKNQRALPRFDSRKLKLKKDIEECLILAGTFKDFEKLMTQKGYALVKGRGVAFIDSKDVRTKGSEVGYSLMTIEKIIADSTLKQSLLQDRIGTKRNESIEDCQNQTQQSGLSRAIEEALRVEAVYQDPPLPLLQKKKRKKRKGLSR
jgi:hypothetical protein